MLIFAAVALVVLGLAAFTLLRARAVEARFPPRGELVALEGGSIHLRESPAIGAERGAILLLHGASGNHADMLNALGEPLAARGFRAIAVDRPGHGWSSRFFGRKASSPQIQAELIRAALARKGVNRAIVVGHSLAGIVALAMTLDAPHFVRGLVLLSPVSHPWPGGVAPYYRLAANPLVGGLFRRLIVLPIGQRVLPAGAAGVFAPNRAPAGYAEATGLALVLRPAQYKANAQDVVDAEANVAALCPRYGEIRTPTTIVTGDRDGVVYAHIHSAGCARDIAGAVLTTLEGVGHSPHYSDPDAVIAAILDVVERAEAGEGKGRLSARGDAVAKAGGAGAS
jgi:pimeloyl-ACP methyl ester carboxylesterase